MLPFSVSNFFPANIYLFNDLIDFVLIILLLTLNIFHTLF